MTRPPNHNDGRVVGDLAWAAKGIDGAALLLDGRNSVRVPSAASLVLTGSHSISVWVRGRASATHFIDGFPDIRAPYFQVCGDTLQLATGSDAYDDDTSTARRQSLRGKDIYHLYTGTADISLGGLRYTHQRTLEPFGGFEPKMQAVGDKVYYEYSGADRRKAVQIWLAEASSDGSGWVTRERTDASRFDVLPPDRGQRDTMKVDEALYRVDHGAIAVARGRIYLAYPAQDERNVWQLWTAVCETNGSGYRAVQRTTDHGWIPSGIQAAGDRVYYLFPKGGDNFETYNHSDIKGTAKGPKTVEGYYVASTDLAGGDWKVLRQIGGPCPSSDPASFQVSNGRIYLIWAQFTPDGSGHSCLYTGDMAVDGSDFHSTPRTVEKGFVGTSIAGGVQVVGRKIYDVFTQDLTAMTYAEAAIGGGTPDHPQPRKRAYSLWIAESNLDGTASAGAKCVLSAPPNVSVGYKGQVVVGAKRYLAPARVPHAFGQGMLGFGGANLVSKGDAYGLGLTEAGYPRGFINAGQGITSPVMEAPLDAAGGAADADQTMTDDSWHHLAEVYDGQQVRLYVDGRLEREHAVCRLTGRESVSSGAGRRLHRLLGGSSPL